MTRHPHPRSLDPQRLVNDLDWNLLRSFVVIVQAGGIKSLMTNAKKAMAKAGKNVSRGLHNYV